MNDNYIKVNRAYLYNLIVEKFEMIEESLLLNNDREQVISVFKDSSKFCHFLEGIVVDNRDISFYSLANALHNSIQSLENKEFRQYLEENVNNKIEYLSSTKSRNKYTLMIISVFKFIVSFQNELIDKYFVRQRFSKYNVSHKNNLPKTFLSYAYDDRGISLGLYIYFLLNKGFLFVDWMWNGISIDSKIVKAKLDDELNSSNQFLFLRTINSELDYYGSPHIRQWCSWEIGNYYTKNKSQKFYTNFYGKSASRNDLLSTFRVFKYVKEGSING